MYLYTFSSPIVVPAVDGRPMASGVWLAENPSTDMRSGLITMDVTGTLDQDGRPVDLGHAVKVQVRPDIIAARAEYGEPSKIIRPVVMVDESKLSANVSPFQKR